MASEITVTSTEVRVNRHNVPVTEYVTTGESGERITLAVRDNIYILTVGSEPFTEAPFSTVSNTLHYDSELTRLAPGILEQIQVLKRDNSWSTFASNLLPGSSTIDVPDGKENPLHVLLATLRTNREATRGQKAIDKKMCEITTDIFPVGVACIGVSPEEPKLIPPSHITRTVTR